MNLKPVTGLFCLTPTGLVPVWAALWSKLMTTTSKNIGNLPFLPPNKKLLFYKHQVLQGYPHQQGGGGDIGDWGGHDQPVSCAGVAGWLRRCFDLCHNDGKSLHHDEEWHTQASKLQHLAEGKLQCAPWFHPVADRKKWRKGGRRWGAVAVVRRPLPLWGLVRPRTAALSASTSIFHTPQPELSAQPTAYTALGIVNHQSDATGF